MFLLKALLMMVVPFYRVDFPVELYPKSFTYTEFRGGKVEETRTVSNSDSEYVALKTFLVEQKHGWSYDFLDYATWRKFSSPKMTVNCLRSGVVVNYEVDDGQWVQISKSITSQAFEACNFLQSDSSSRRAEPSTKNP
jgi:hypothetical protein